LRKFLVRNKKLDELLRVKIAKLNQDQQLSLGFSPSFDSQMQQFGMQNTSLDPEIQQQLQAHGFDFSEPVVSPRTESGTSDMSYQSPPPQLTPPFQNSLPAGQQPLPELAQVHSQSSDQIWDQAQEQDQNLIMSQDLFNQFQDFAYNLDTSGGDIQMNNSIWMDPTGSYPSNLDDRFRSESLSSWPQNQSNTFDS
jgi:hypothetical protein